MYESSQSIESENKRRFEVTNPRYHFIFGEFQSDFANRKLLQFQDRIDGIKAEINGGGHEAAIILSNPKGEGKKEILRGTNSQGPYEVAFKPVVPNTEHVFVNGKEQIKDTDYTIDYTLGRITFRTAIITPEQEITLQYESRNPAFLDTVSGGRYRFSGFRDLDTQVYFLQKRSSTSAGQTVAVTQKELVLIAQEVSANALKLTGEIAASKFVPNTQSMDVFHRGIAGAAQADLKTDLLSLSVYATKLGSSFEPLNTYNLAPGDLKYGAEGHLKVDSHNFDGKYDYQKIVLSNVPQEDKEGSVRVQSKLSDLSFSGSVQQRIHQEFVASPNLNSYYDKKTYLVMGESPLIVGKLTGSVSRETKDNIGVPSESFQNWLLQSGYSVQLFEHADVGIEPSYKTETKQSGAATQEKSLKVSSKVYADSNNSISGKVETRSITGQARINLFNLTAAFSPVSFFSAQAQADMESLREPVGATTVDTEKLDANFNATLSPFQQVRLKYTLKPKYKKFKDTGLNGLEKTENIYEATFPLFQHRLSYLKRFRKESAAQITYYPNFVFQNNILDDTTDVMRGKFKLTNDIGADLQYETETKVGQTLTATSNPTYATTQSRATKFKAETTYQWQNTAFGVAWENAVDRTELPTSNRVTKDTYTGSARTSWMTALTTTEKFNIIRNDENGTLFTSVKPEAEINWRILPQIVFNLKYSVLKEFRANAQFSEIWAADIKSELSQNLILNATYAQENHQNPDYNTFEGTFKVNVVF